MLPLVVVAQLELVTEVVAETGTGCEITTGLPKKGYEQLFASFTSTVMVYVPAGAEALNTGVATVVPPPSCAAAVPVHAYVVNVPPVALKVIAVPGHTVRFGLPPITGLKLLFIVTVIAKRGPSQFGEAVSFCDT